MGGKPPPGERVGEGDRRGFGPADIKTTHNLRNRERPGVHVHHCQCIFRTSRRQRSRAIDGQVYHPPGGSPPVASPWVC